MAARNVRAIQLMRHLGTCSPYPFVLSKIYTSLVNEGYSPHAWREQPLHFQPPQQYSPSDPRTKACLDWIFLVSSLNFSFWSEKEGTGNEAERFGVEWTGWSAHEPKKVWTGYWSLVAAINKGQILAALLYPQVTLVELYSTGSRDTDHRPQVLCFQGLVPRCGDRRRFPPG